ncbi:MAG: DUF4411 family protein [Candidatus Moraniibacteriota bacterium]
MHVFDASSMIYAWDNYPPDQFPPLWDWMSDQVSSHQILIPKKAFEEISYKIADCASWLRANDVEIVDVSGEILQEAFGIKQTLEIVNDNYHPSGVDENDILIVATAKLKRVGLVTNEAVQNSLPNVKAKYKIPAVCNLVSVNISSISFIQFIRQSGVVFQGQ